MNDDLTELPIGRRCLVKVSFEHPAEIRSLLKSTRVRNIINATVGAQEEVRGAI